MKQVSGLTFFYNMGNCPDEKIIKIFASIYLSGLINSYSHKIQNPGIDSTTPGFYLALFTKNKFLLTSFIVLFVYMSYFPKIASSLRLLTISSKLAPASTEPLACACLK